MRRISIIQGEHAVVREPGVMITTLLGSCVAVCLHDPTAHVGGMNHFLLAEPDPNRTVRPEERQRYGVHAMELLINDMMKNGAARPRMRAHIYGGANIIAGLGSIGSDNAAFAKRFMEIEGIAIGHCDVGGRSPRKVEFLPWDGMARAVHVSEVPASPVAVKPLPVGGDIELF